MFGMVHSIVGERAVFPHRLDDPFAMRTARANIVCCLSVWQRSGARGAQSLHP
jgi:hypothetical protein